MSEDEPKMPRHQDPLVSFDVPRDWENRSIIAFSAPPQPGGDGVANLVITRDRLAEEEDLIDYAERHVDELQESMDGFSLIGHEKHEVGGRQALTVSFTSEGHDGALAQRLTMVLLADRMVASITLTAPERESEQMDPLFERILSSVKWESP